MLPLETNNGKRLMLLLLPPRKNKRKTTTDPVFPRLKPLPIPGIL